MEQTFKMDSTLYKFFDDVWNKSNIGKIRAYCSEDLIAHGIDAKIDVAGTAALEKFFEDIHDRFSKIRIIPTQVTREGNLESSVCTISALHISSNKRVTFTGTSTARIDQGLITELWIHFDFLAIQAQLDTPVVNYQVVSYNTLRRAIGFTGLLLPLVIVIGYFINKGTKVQPSISDYYFTSVGDLFVGCLCAVSFFLFCYRGHESRDNRAANLAALFALCIALFPTSTELDASRHIGLLDEPGISTVIHFTSATLFFITLAYFSLFLFRKSAGKKTKNKKKRNRI